MQVGQVRGTAHGLAVCMVLRQWETPTRQCWQACLPTFLCLTSYFHAADGAKWSWGALNTLSVAMVTHDSCTALC